MTDTPIPESLPLEATQDLTQAPSAGPEVTEVRHGAFGVRGTGDTSGFGGLARTVEIPGSSPRPYGGWFDAAVDTLVEDLRGIGLAEALEKVVVDRGELTLFVRREHLTEVARLLRDDQDLRFELSLGVNGVHYPADKGRELHAVYHLMSVTHGRRVLRLEVTAPDADPNVPSLVSVYPTQDWHERETYDMFGIVFVGHPALARILLPNDWVGHPQRKDYPLGGVDVQFKGAVTPPPDRRRSYS
ncbi:MAG: NADH-quinone oxidoreductase subunit C [Bifidobacteriaceae bacterium]|jgi:NADH-quinone oxidoreductase subunit C|nr:NADH-quinone oxidoreductase subunit C [Bifidobacteriaceae bacterium]